MSIDNRDPTTITELKIMHLLFALGWIAVVDHTDTKVG